jgi:uncharacterized protein (TIGR01777 family)
VSKNILITGGSGLIGSKLTQLLQTSGFQVAHLSRSPRSNRTKSFLWDTKKGFIDASALRGVEAIVHLAGTNVGEKRWTKQRKEEILKSRLESTALLYDELKKGDHQVATFVSASATGFYGFDDEEHYYTEDDKKGEGFQADVVGRWEQAVDRIATLGIRVVKIRGGVVLSEKGGALKEMMLPIKLYVGSPLGTGEQTISWIHIEDLCRIFIMAIEHENMQGVYNAVAPNPATNEQFTYAVAKALRRPVWLPRIPAFVLNIIFGELAEVVLKGSKVSARKIQSSGFKFKFANLEEALSDLLRAQRVV